MSPIFTYLKNGLGDFLVSYMQDHKDEVINAIIEVLKHVFGHSPDAKAKVLTAFGECPDE